MPLMHKNLDSHNVPVNIKAEPVPRAIAKSMQGLAFWIGYQHSLLESHDLLEGATAAEFYRLLSRNISSDEFLLPEFNYSRLWADFGGKERCDLVVFSKQQRQPKSQKPEFRKSQVRYVIEVKRSKTPSKHLKKDLERLSKTGAKSKSSHRAFLLIVSQASVPKSFREIGSFINQSGVVSKRSVFDIKVAKGECVPIRIRRVCKASTSFNTKASRAAHYVVLIEVFSKRKF